MKIYKHLYPQVYDFGNLYWAYRAARCSKRDREAVAAFEFNLEHNKCSSLILKRTFFAS